MFKKGISPLIATVLLIGFTIILSMIVVNWTRGTIDDQTDNPVFDVETKNICLSAARDLEFSFGGTSSSGFVVDIKNKGPNEFSSVRVLWKDVSGSIGDNSNSPAIIGFGSGSTTSNNGTDYKSAKVVPYVSELECNGFDVLMEPILNAYFLDFDNDGYGDPLNFVLGETMLPGYVENSLDCADGNQHENPDENGPCNCPSGESHAFGSESCFNNNLDDH